jgi:hypothetical protein
MPTDAERAGDFSASVAPPIDPATGLPFPDGVVPLDRISSQARALLGLYPQPNFNSAGPFNYQVPIAGTSQGDNFQGNITNIRIGRADQLSGTGGYQTTHSDGPTCSASPMRRVRRRRAPCWNMPRRAIW